METLELLASNPQPEEETRNVTTRLLELEALE